VLIESSGIAEPMQVSETFFVDLENGKGPLQEQARLDNCVTVVDASTLRIHLQTDSNMNVIDPRAEGEEAKQHISALLLDQLEFANVILLNKVDKVLPNVPKKERDDEIKALTSILRSINRSAKIISTVHCDVDVKEILNTNNFSLEFANGMNRWLEDIKTGVAHVPETLEYGVASFLYNERRAFHPQRFSEWILRYFVLEGEREGPKANGTAEERRAARIARYGDLFRSKGFVYLGNPRRTMFYGVINHSGNTFSLSRGSLWEDFPVALSNETCAQEPGQQLVFIGQNLKKEHVRADLDACLLTKREETLLKAAVRKDMCGPNIFPDTLPEFDMEVEEDEEDEEEEEVQGAPPQWKDSMTVSEVKQQVCKINGLDPSTVDLWCGDTVLADDRRIRDYPEALLSTARRVVRPKGWREESAKGK